MRKRVTIQTRADAESGTYSGESVRANLVSVATVWARIENVTGTAQVDSRNAGTGITHRVWIRHRSDVTVQNELLYTDGTGTQFRYMIQTVQVEGDERNRFLVLECKQMAESSTLKNPSPE
jgi:SPP1 family predicted phage head-tail adaptor